MSLDTIAGNTDVWKPTRRSAEPLKTSGAWVPERFCSTPFRPASPGDPIQSAWFASSLLPTKADFLGFAAWQIRSRTGVDAVLRIIDLHAAAASVAGTDHVGELVREMIRTAPVDGIVIDPPGPFPWRAATNRVPFHAWRVRAERDRIAASAAEDSLDNRLALQAWKIAEQELRPGLR